MGRRAGLALFISFAGCATAQSLPAELEAFRFEGKPIHPAIINEFIPWISDGDPVIAAVDLEGFTRSRNRLCGWTVKEEKGGVDGTREGNGGFLWYQHLGRDEFGNHYLEIYDNGGGSASWRYLMELRFEVVEAYGARRLLLRCVNIEDLRCCAFGKVDKKLVPEPCGRHPRPIPETEAPNVPTSGPALTDPDLLSTWAPVGNLFESMLGRIRIFGHSLFIERMGCVEFEILASSPEKCLLRLARDVDDCRFLKLTFRPPSSKQELELSFHRTEEKARASFSTESEDGATWGVFVR